VFEIGTAIDILFCTLMRRRNLASLDIEEHLQRDLQGRIIGIMVAPDETKNRVVIDCDLPSDTRGRLQRFLKDFRPHLPGATESAWLFPSVGGRHRSPHMLANAISKYVFRRLGTNFNVHLARHLGALILLEEDPNNLPTVQYLLAHKSIDTTASMYGVIRNRGAQAQWHQHLAGRVKLLRRS
jgi:site-specific recombinase XerD